ncbi:MAG: DUF4258 domain-containing protein [Aetokthonos hydrillicola CCALA 1050]|uniref:RHS repeat-associated core domain-containing protein n=1 Tax=Aetokthonos hydrillicola TaxID=1550245 RepID=UPI0028779C3C|nr:RHS repeat-associated core domain-containing protein [Aetokthonos hydrillicola]MBW4590146.1 DUF4258 domain-containing protein [Aetokthonos hydrillicola CCALA 1050]
MDNITAIVDNVSTDRTQAFVYDAEDRLLKATQNGVSGYGVIDYTYDLNGNRLSRVQTVGGSVVDTEAYTYLAGSNRLASVNDNGVVRGLGYNASGAVDTDTRGAGSSDDLAFSYNNAARISSLAVNSTVTTRYVYTAEGERVQKLLGNSALVERYHYDLDGHLLAVTDGSNALTVEYIYVGDTPIAQITGAGILSYVHTDHLGTPQKLSNDTGTTVTGDFRWQPFGTSLNAANNYRLKFPGQQFDSESGLYYNYFRTYDPTLGRYLESDPIGLDGGWNLYNYANQSPILYADRRGELAWFIPIIIGAAVGAGIDYGLQHYFHPGCPTDWKDVAISAALGGLGGAAAPAAEGAAAAGAAAESAAAKGAGRGVADDIATAVDDFTHPSTPVGRRGAQASVPRGTNSATNIGGRNYSGHALDRMQERGITPTTVEDAIRNGVSSPGNRVGTTVHNGTNVTVVTGSNGNIITVYPK